MKRTSDIAIMALMAALCFIAFNYFKFDIHVMGDRTSLHFANAFVVLGALLLGGFQGGLAGALGLTLADLTTGYAHVAPKTFVLKFMIGLIAGMIAHRFGKISHQENDKKVLRWVMIASSLAMLFNVIFDPLVGYLLNRFILGIESDPANIIAAWSAGVTFINAVITVVMSSLLYMALRRMKFTKPL